MAESPPMILDTCALLWLASGDKELSRATLRKIDEAPVVYLSSISGFEVALKAGQGKLRLPAPPLEWVEKAARQHGLTVLPLDLAACARAAGLPSIHDDPFDRFIIATALLRELAVVTKDARFAEYGVTVLT